MDKKSKADKESEELKKYRTCQRLAPVMVRDPRVGHLVVHHYVDPETGDQYDDAEKDALCEGTKITQPKRKR